MSSQHAVRAPA